MNRSPGCSSRLVYSDAVRSYDFGPEHPLTPRRLLTGLSLLRALGVLTDADLLAPREATDEELQLVHAPDYVAAVKRLSNASGRWSVDTLEYGLGPGDNPAFPGMHHAAALIAGGTVELARAVMAGELQHGFNPAGGLHHALRDRASGFCIYNDPAVAIAALLREHEARVLYLDFDCHHGDGVQWLFYDDPRVMTVSFHETGRHLFPGTGDVYELGTGLGRGYSINVPMAPYTQDDSWLDAVRSLVPALAERFRPDVIVSQHGCDTHTWDPLTHLALTTRAYDEQARLVHALAHEHCQGRWIALGGGGYDFYRVVPRSWALVWLTMTGRPAPDYVPEAYIAEWQDEAPQRLPELLLDPPEEFPPLPRHDAILAENRRTLETVRRLALPPPLLRGFPLLRLEALGPTTSELVSVSGQVPSPRVETIQTPRGPVHLRDWCPPSMLERLRPDPGLVAFCRSAEREMELLRRLAEQSEVDLIIAHTPEGVVVGQVTITLAEGWWAGLEGVFEISLEVARDWRRLGLARQLLRFAAQPDAMEDLILLAEGYWWHWDLEATGLNPFAYRALLQRLFGQVGFQEMRTTEPDIAGSPANSLLVRIGARVSPERAQQFRARVLRLPRVPAVTPGRS